MIITLLEPYFNGSHAAWSTEYAARSRHTIHILKLSGSHWKWRMHGGAVTLARKFLDSGFAPDLLLASDMLDLTTFLALTRSRTSGCKSAIYFHENQLTYPWSPTDKDPRYQRDMHYAFINYSSALAADAVIFNSEYHKDAFLAGLPEFLGSFPDHQENQTINQIAAHSVVLPLGMDLRRLDRSTPLARKNTAPPLILWNHRWEYDKNPESFFRVLTNLADEGYPFEVAVLGESFSRQPRIFAEARQRLVGRIAQWGYVPDFSTYANWLWQADILPVTSVHDFFGGSVVQAIYCGCTPLLPNRLAYPEHLPKQHQASCLYENDDELSMKLKELLLNNIAPAPALRQTVSQYDWDNMAPAYDDYFEKLALHN
jgi:glycosyltransferase involved in cell wall biosynthesis